MNHTCILYSVYCTVYSVHNFQYEFRFKKVHGPDRESDHLQIVIRKNRLLETIFAIWVFAV